MLRGAFVTFRRELRLRDRESFCALVGVGVRRGYRNVESLVGEELSGDEFFSKVSQESY